MANAYPLSWPDGWPRTPSYKRQDSKYRFRRNGSFWTFAAARDALSTELDRIGARGVVLSSNYELRLDGLPRASGPQPSDTGIAVYFLLRDRQMVMASDMHMRGEENMRSITLSLEAMRQLGRHGGGMMMERAFQGFAALPPPIAGEPVDWRVLLGLVGEPNPSREQIEHHFRIKAKSAHPDVPGGSHELMSRLNAARERALQAVGAQS